MACNLRRENGLFDGRVDKAMAWSEGLEQRVLHSRKEKALPMEYTNIVYVETLQAIIFGLQAKHGITKSTQVAFVMDSGKGQVGPEIPWRSAASRISSISLSPPGIILVTMLGGGHSAFGVELTGDAAGPKGLFDKIHTGVLSHSPNVSYWASTANPYSWQTIFAVAASNGALILNPSEAIWNIDRDVFNSLDQSEVMAVDWLDANVVIKGRKDGGVRLWDIRGRGDVHRLRHPSQINHARRLGNQSTIVVAGLDSQLCTYDMRYASNPATSPGEVTNPCIRFPSYQNLGMGHLAAGFDTHGDLIAAATDDGRVIIWDGQSASELKEEKWNKATCLKFIDEPETPKVLRLMGTAGQSIVGLAW